MPSESGEKVIDSLVSHVFRQVELLYRESLNPKSIAFSDFWTNATDTEVDELAAPDAAENVDERKLEGFRIIIPHLFDISLSPGWHKRPEPPFPHSKAEHLRQSVVLTERWNSKMRSEMESWVSKGSTRPGGMENSEATPEVAPEAAPETAPETAPEAAPEAASDAAPEISERDDTITAPYPRRLGIQTDTARSIVDAMTEEEMQRTGAKDSQGLGSLPISDPMRFLDVWTPCASMVQRLPEVGWETDSQICEVPDDHLFFNSFALGQRAIDGLAKQTASDVLYKLLVQDKSSS